MANKMINIKTVSTLIILCLPLLVPAIAYSHSGNMMHDDMNDDQMGEHMNGRGHMYGGGWNQMMPRGDFPAMPMMGHMMRGNMMTGPMSGMLMGRLSGLGLNDSQRKKIRKIHRDMRKKHLKLMEQMMEATDNLADIYEADPGDIEKIGAAYDKVYKIKRDMILQHVESRNKVTSLLDDKQKKLLKDRQPFMGQHMMMH